MAEKQGYAQYCPISIAAEVVAERWTPLIVRALCLGATRYNEIHDNVPRMSSALLSRRLRELEDAGVVERRPAVHGRGSRYNLTEAGRELFPILEGMGFWAQKWLRREITRDRNLDPDMLMWELRRNALNSGMNVEGRRVVHFQLDGVPADRRLYWLVFEGSDVDVCRQDLGHEVTCWVSAHMRTIVEVWLGHRSLKAAREDGSLRVDGDPEEIRAFNNWFTLSHFAKEPH